MNKSSIRLLAAAAISLSAAGSVLVPCSVVSSGIGGPMLGSDGLVHWTGPGASLGIHSGLRERGKSVYWFTRTDAGFGGVEPRELRLRVPEFAEGNPNLLWVLPDGASWWSAWCSDWDPPDTITCGSLVLVGPEGEPLGRVSTPRFGRLFFESDRSILSLEVADPGGDGGPRQDRSNEKARRLQLWRGTALGLEALDQPANNDFWDDDYSKREANRPRDGWQLTWEVPFPFSYREGFDRSMWTLSANHRMLAVIVSTQETVRVGVYALSSQGARSRLEPRYEEEYPRAHGGLSNDEKGDFALAPPWSIALSSEGKFAMGNWAIHSDCSKDRPDGFVVLGKAGEVIADVRADQDHGRIDGMAFDRNDDVVVTAGPKMQTYNLEGELLSESNRIPEGWRETAEERWKLARELTAASPLEDWVDLYPLLEDTSGGAATARGIFVRAWPAVEEMLNEDLWLDLAPEFCSFHPDAAESVLRRFEEARGQRKIRWLRVLPECFAEAPASAQATSSEYLTMRDSDRRDAARFVLARWPKTMEAMDQLWDDVVAGGNTSDYQVLTRASQAKKQLLGSLVPEPGAFSARLAGSPDELSSASAVLFSSFSAWALDYVPPQMEPVRAALLRAARRWSADDNQNLAVVGGLLLLGHGEWPGIGLGRQHGANLDVGLSRTTKLLQAAVDAQGGEHALWAALAVQRVLSAHGVPVPGEYGRTLVPSPELLGLPRVQVVALFHRLGVVQVEEADQLNRFIGQHGVTSQDPRFVLARSLGETGREAMLSEVQREPGGGASGPKFWEVTQWMSEDLEPWREEAIRFVLDRLADDPNAGWQSGPMLDAVVRSFSPAHALHRRAREIFEANLDEAIAAAEAPPEVSNSALAMQRASRRSFLFPQMVSHLLATGSDGQQVSPVLSQLEVDDVERLAAGATADLDRWYGLMGIVGPWPAAVPELERLLRGNSRLQAAIVLSHLQHPEALEVLLGVRGSMMNQSSISGAIARYGSFGVQGLLAQALKDLKENGKDTYTLGLFEEIVATSPTLIERASAESVSELEASLRASLGRALASDQWPDPSVIMALEMLSVDAFALTLGSIERLPLDANSVRSFVFQSGGRRSRFILDRLARAVRLPQHPLHSAAVRIVRPLAAEGVKEARWMLEQSAEAQEDRSPKE